jgi:hypothetical protein
MQVEMAWLHLLENNSIYTWNLESCTVALCFVFKNMQNNNKIGWVFYYIRNAIFFERIWPSLNELEEQILIAKDPWYISPVLLKTLPSQGFTVSNRYTYSPADSSLADAPIIDAPSNYLLGVKVIE